MKCGIAENDCHVQAQQCSYFAVRYTEAGMLPLLVCVYIKCLIACLGVASACGQYCSTCIHVRWCTEVLPLLVGYTYNGTAACAYA